VLATESFHNNYLLQTLTHPRGCNQELGRIAYGAPNQKTIRSSSAFSVQGLSRTMF
jgi:hypothetical protein